MEAERETMSKHEKTEQTEQDFVNEMIDSGDSGEEHPRWHKHVSLIILIMALLAAMGVVLAGMTANQALIERTEEIIEVNIMEGDRIYVRSNLRRDAEVQARNSDRLRRITGPG
jgi:hypothetical protein